MQREWHPDALVEHWTILPAERKLIGNKHRPTRLGFAIRLTFLQHEGRFPHHPAEVPSAIVDYIAQQVGIASEMWKQYDWHGRSIEYHRARLRQQLGFREASVTDGEALSLWLCDHILSTIHRVKYIREALSQRCRDIYIEPPTPDRVERLIRSALQQFETWLSKQVLHRLSPTTRQKLDALLIVDDACEDNAHTSETPDSGTAVWHDLRADPGRPSLDNLLREMTRLERVRDLDVPLDLFDHLSPKVLQTYRQRVAVEAPYELRRHPEPLRMTLLAVFAHCRGRELADTLVGMLIELIHRIGTKAERKVEKELLEDLKKIDFTKMGDKIVSWSLDESRREDIRNMTP